MIRDEIDKVRYGRKPARTEGARASCSTPMALLGLSAYFRHAPLTDLGAHSGRKGLSGAGGWIA